MKLKLDENIPQSAAFEPGKHAGVLIVRLPDSEQRRVGDHLVGWFSDPDAHTWERCIVGGGDSTDVPRGFPRDSFATDSVAASRVAGSSLCKLAPVSRPEAGRAGQPLYEATRGPCYPAYQVWTSSLEI